MRFWDQGEGIMAVPDCPRVRPGLAAAPEDRDGQFFVVCDRLRLSEAEVRVSALELDCLQLFDGRHSLRDVQARVMQWTGGQIVPLDLFQALADRFDQALFLDGPRYRERAGSEVRPPSCIGCYEGDPAALRRQLRRLFTGPGAAGLPGEARPRAGLRAALVPHIDYARGGATYTWAFKEVFEHTPAALFVIIGTSHYSRYRFTLTRKNFQTPLGVVPTDQAYIDKLAARYGDGLFEDELLAHLPEHSIELEVVFLQYLYEGKRPIRIVPLVVGSFHDSVQQGRLPAEEDDIGRMIEALRAVERETPEPVCYLISGDLAHIGPKFGDRRPVSAPQLAHSRGQDQEILKAAAAADPAAYFRVIAAEGDGRRICGLPPTYTVLEAMRPRGGKLLHYDQYVHPRGFESVSFASVAFYQ
jgi:AmmeMemoRadiSam system protein B